MESLTSNVNVSSIQVSLRSKASMLVLICFTFRLEGRRNIQTDLKHRRHWSTKQAYTDYIMALLQCGCKPSFLTWFHVFRKSVELENKSSSSKSPFLAYRWSKETVEGDTSTTILSNYEHQVTKTLPTHTVYTWNDTVLRLLSTENSNFSSMRHAWNPDMLEMVTWQARADDTLHQVSRDQTQTESI